MSTEETPELALHSEEMVRIMKDPVLWARHHLDSDPRWYQEQILRHPHNRKVLRCGRRIGKCIAEGQRVLLADGSYVPVETLYLNQEKQQVVSLGPNVRNQVSELYEVSDNGMKEVFRVTTRRGLSIELTGNHPLLTADGWVEVDDLTVGEYLATPNQLAYFGQNDTRSEAFVGLLAYLVTSCVASENLLSLEIKKPASITQVKEYCETLGLTLIQRSQKTFFIVDKTRSSDVIAVFREANGRIPEEVFTYTKEKLAYFLMSLYESQGWQSYKTSLEIGFGSRDQVYLQDIAHLLLRFGIHPSMVRRTVNQLPYFQMMIFRAIDIVTFVDEVAFKQRNSYQALYHLASDKAEDSRVFPRGKRFEEELVIQKIPIRKNGTKTMQWQRLHHLAKKYQSAYFQDLIMSDLFYDVITKIEPLGEKQTYDVFVPETQNLVVEDFYVHNTWTMVAHILWVSFTCNSGLNPKGATCVVATPYDTQARLIFDEIVKNIEGNDILRQSLKTKTKNPYYIEFKNGSKIKLFTAGTKSGSEGGSLRGQAADWLYMDEVDYMSDADFDTISAIALEAPKRIGIMIASTPTGRRGMFYKTCTELKFNQDDLVNSKNTKNGYIYNTKNYNRETAEGWKEFYYPTMVNPEWSESMEKELKKQFSAVAYDHEVLAEFGSEMVGVFNKDMIDEASSVSYSLSTIPLMPGGLVAIGVDWDKYGAATNIVVVEYDPYDKRRERPEMEEETSYGRFKVINRIEVAKSEMHYDNAVKMIKELNERYNPFAIYCDRGAGEYQIELLRKELGEKVKGVHLGSSYDVLDPVSKIKERKPLKPFLVNQTTLILERGQLRIPSELVEETIRRQMTNYQVIRVSAKTNEPVFSSTDEHSLDAMMFALFAFLEHHPDLVNTIFKIQNATKTGKIRTNMPTSLDELRQRASLLLHSDNEPEWDEPGLPPLKKVPLGSKPRSSTMGGPSWGNRNHLAKRRSPIKRKSW